MILFLGISFEDFVFLLIFSLLILVPVALLCWLIISVIRYLNRH